MESDMWRITSYLHIRCETKEVGVASSREPHGHGWNVRVGKDAGQWVYGSPKGVICP